MFEYITGEITEITPTFVVLETQGVAFYIQISLNTYSELSKVKNSKVFIHQVIRDDAHLLYGFSGKHEREMFRFLISVSGIGASSARMILSALTPGDLRESIVQGNVAALKAIKGIGAKTAQRLIVDLRDKVGKVTGEGGFLNISGNTIREESLSALATLGFSKSAVLKVVDDLISKNPEIGVESLLREALKRL